MDQKKPDLEIAKIGSILESYKPFELGVGRHAYSYTFERVGDNSDLWQLEGSHLRVRCIDSNLEMMGIFVDHATKYRPESQLPDNSEAPFYNVSTGYLESPNKFAIVIGF